MMIRIYLIFRVLAVFSVFNTKYSDKISQKNDQNAGITMGLVIKSLLSRNPYKMLILFFVITSIMISFTVRIFERPYYEDKEAGSVPSTDPSYQDYKFYSNSLWLVTVTMTTVGYGDFFPRTHLGRATIIVACFLGVFIVSLAIVTLKKSSEFNYGEQSTYDILLRLRIK